MRRTLLLILTLALPAALPAQGDPPKAVVLSFMRFADVFGGRLVAAFDSIPAARYDYRPTPVQQTVGYIAQHLEDANYGLCERLGVVRRRATAKDSLADTIKARWPKDTLVARLDASLRFCDAALQGLSGVTSAAHTSTLLAFETDLAEHYSQLATYMRLLGLVPPSALPLRQPPAVMRPPSALSPYVGRYTVFSGVELVVTLADSALWIQSLPGGAAVRLVAASDNAFYVKDVDIQVTFIRRDPGGPVVHLLIRQFGRERWAERVF